MKYQVELPNADHMLRQKCYDRAEDKYGSPLPDAVRDRLDLEVTAIAKGRYSSMYLIVSELADVNAGLPVTVRGTLGASFVAYMLHLSTCNSLPPHYHCSTCHHYAEIDIGPSMVCDLPVKKCPLCGADMLPDGYNLLPEIHMGVDFNKEPIFHLNMTQNGRRLAIQHLKDVFGDNHICRAGVKRLMKKTGSIRRSTHPSGIYIVPSDCQISEITDLRPCNPDDEHNLMVTEEDYTTLDLLLPRLNLSVLPQLDMLLFLKQETKYDYREIPMSALSDPAVLMIAEKRSNIYPAAIAWHPGERIRRKAFRLTYPTSLADLLRLEGALHGFATWIENGECLIEKGFCLSDLITSRDDLIETLLAAGIDKHYAFSMLSAIRPGAGLTDEMILSIQKAGIPDWYINSLKRIKYLFPRSQAIEYAVQEAKLAFYQDRFPEEFIRVFNRVAELYDNPV